MSLSFCFSTKEINNGCGGFFIEEMMSVLKTRHGDVSSPDGFSISFWKCWEVGKDVMYAFKGFYEKASSQKSSIF